MESLDLDIGKRIKIAMMKENCRQTDLAKKLKITRVSVSNKLNGKAKFSINELIKISKMLKIKIEYIIFG